MAEENEQPRTGPWQDRVRFAPGGLAYTPGEVLLPESQRDQAAAALQRVEDRDEREQYGRAMEEAQPVLDGAFVLLRGLRDALRAVAVLHQAGVRAQPDHVLFATCCCPPHPATRAGSKLYAEPFYADSLTAAPFYADPFYADPFYADATAGGCGCCCGGASANPFYADPFYADPFYADAPRNPALDPAGNRTGRRRSSARPHGAPSKTSAEGNGAGVRVAILDTGWAQSHRPTALSGMNLVDRGGDRPDEDADGFLDPASGHGTFIAGVIEQLTPGCSLELFPSLGSYGDGSETQIATTLLELAQRPEGDRPHLVNLSFGGYSPIGMAVLAHPIAALQAAGVVVVSSAGNDATCRPSAPAALPGVIGVAALDDDDNAAPFTNYGRWVRACTFGQDVVSLFFEKFDGGEPAVGGVDQDSFDGWARWSGTSFAAPRLVARLAAEIHNGMSPNDAVAHLIDAPGRTRKPMLGTHVP